MLQLPLRMVADIRVVEGPSMIKSENGRLRSYVTLNVAGRDIVGFIDEAKQAVRDIEASLAGTGMSIEWTGEFENQIRARHTLAIIFPLVITLILFLLYITFNDILDTLLVFLAVIGALAGALMFQALFGFNFSVIVSIGYIAAFGMATETGVIMLVYLRDAIHRRGGLENISSSPSSVRPSSKAQSTASAPSCSPKASPSSASSPCSGLPAPAPKSCAPWPPPCSAGC